MKPNEVGLIMDFVDLNLDMQILGEEENLRAVIERKQEQSREIACTETPTSFSYGIGFPTSKFQIKSN